MQGKSKSWGDFARNLAYSTFGEEGLMNISLTGGGLSASGHTLRKLAPSIVDFIAGLISFVNTLNNNWKMPLFEYSILERMDKMSTENSAI